MKTLGILAGGMLLAAAAQAAPLVATHASTTYHYVSVDGVRIFYREAGPKDAPTLVLLHGFPSSSREFATLFPLLATRYHLIAPDFPGFGQSDAPAPDAYAYTFDHLAETTDGFLDALGLRKYALYLHDYGGPVGFRVMLKHPERVTALVVSNANAYTEGLGKKWTLIGEYWKDPKAHPEVFETFISPAATEQRHTAGTSHPEKYDPDAWGDEIAHLARPGQREIQASLLYDYRTNVAAYPAWQAWLRSHRPPTLVVWGKNDPSFIGAGGEAYRRDVPEAEVHLLDAGHFPWEEQVDAIAGYVLPFLDRHVR
ncbi:alpha/beta fold hydrolase [Luteibacter sp. CQ10]|uniref:alpha/beta fold hydrolase n=1 Tax=Luteibacter sp. CQ10 TaxID=2805821 RepID=UPI0034A20CB9